MKKIIYVDNGATTRLHPDALKAMMPYFCDEYANPSGSCEPSIAAANAVKMSRYSCARLINAQGNDIYFTSGGTESDNWAIKCGTRLGERKGGHIITSMIEHHAILNSCKYMESEGYSVTYLKPDAYGIISPESVMAAIREDTVLISVMTANNEVGSIQPIKAIGYIARKNQILFHTDAVQACGHIPINVRDCSVDFLSASAHKFCGPKGMGFLYVAPGNNLRSFMDGGSQEMGMRAGTTNVPGAVGMGKAAEICTKNLRREGAYVTRLRNRLIGKITDSVPDAILTGHPKLRLPGNASFCFPGRESTTMLTMLNARGICAAAGSACQTGAKGPSHVLMAMGISENTAKGALRITLSAELTESDIDFIADEVVKAAKRA